MRLNKNWLGWDFTMRRGGALMFAATATAIIGPAPARAVDEIQVYNAEIAEVGQFTVQQHLNYTIIGHTQPEFPGGLVPNHALNGTPEFAWGITPWFELGLYVPWAVNAEDQLLSNAFKLRTLLVTPDAAKKDFFYGLNFEYDFPTPPFGQMRFAMEIRPIIGWRNPQWEFIVNPIVDLSFGTLGTFDFVPAARLARKLGDDVFIGIEYYADLGAPGSFPSFQQQSHQVFGVVDFKVGEIDVDFGLGYGITGGSDRFIVKTILGYAFPIPGQDQADKSSLKAPLTTRAGMRATSAADVASDPFLGMR